MRHITLAGGMSSEDGFDVLVGHQNNASGYFMFVVCSAQFFAF
jgi:hypothetical protein